MHFAKQMSISFVVQEDSRKTLKAKAFLCFSVRGWCREKATLIWFIKTAALMPRRHTSLGMFLIHQRPQKSALLPAGINNP